MATISDAARFAYDLAFQVSPIILVDGIASNSIGGMLPIIGLTGQLAAAFQGAASSGSLSEDDFFARFLPVPGSTLVSQQVATYPFANQAVAANATIQQPLNISLRMIAPVKDTAGYLTKLAIFTSLQNSLVAHNAAGGRYHIATPAFIFTNCLMLQMTDIGDASSRQQMVQFQIDFTRPLVTGEQLTQTYNSLMSKLSSGGQVTPPTTAGTSFWSNPAVAVGSAAQNALSNIGQISGVVNQYLSRPAL
jgi:hypothetical protein